VRKYATRAEASVALDVEDAWAAVPVDGADPESVVRTQYAALEDAGVNTSDRTAASIDASAAQRLEELGYIR
jgi:hypothetical protein